MLPHVLAKTLQTRKRRGRRVKVVKEKAVEKITTIILAQKIASKKRGMLDVDSWLYKMNKPEEVLQYMVLPYVSGYNPEST